MHKEKHSIMDLTAKEIETRSYSKDPDMLEEEQDAISELSSRVNKLVLNKEATVEIKENELGVKNAIVTHEGKIIYSTENPSEVANFELFLKDPEAALKVFQGNLESALAEQAILNEIHKLEEEPEE